MHLYYGPWHIVTWLYARGAHVCTHAHSLIHVRLLAFRAGTIHDRTCLGAVPVRVCALLCVNTSHVGRRVFAGVLRTRTHTHTHTHNTHTHVTHACTRALMFFLRALWILFVRGVCYTARCATAQAQAVSASGFRRSLSQRLPACNLSLSAWLVTNPAHSPPQDP